MCLKKMAYFIGCVILVCFLVLTYAEAEEGKDKGSSKSQWVHFSGNVGFVSNYIQRGQTQTFDGPAVQGEMIFFISPKEEEGFYVGLWGSNVDSTTATNGAGLELDLKTGYVYKPLRDLTLKLELLNTRYPRAYANLETRDSFDGVEIYPSITYQYFTLLWAYSFTSVRGVNQNFAPGFLPIPLVPNGSSKGSWYGEASLKFPIPNTENKLNFLLSAGYWRIRNYSVLSYAVFGTGLSYTIPESFGGLTFSVNGSVTNAKKQYYAVENVSGKRKNLVAPKIWVGVTKEF